MLSEIEGKCSSVLHTLDTLRAVDDLGDESVTFLLIHLALQHSTTQAAREVGQALHDKLMQMWLEVQISNSTSIAEEQRSLLLESLPYVQADPVQAQRVAMGTAIEAADSLSDLALMVLVNKTNRPFIFGDAPVVLYNPHCRDVTQRGVLGYAALGLIVLLPLTSWTCLVLLDPGVYEALGLRGLHLPVRNLRDVAALNKLQLHAASGCIYFEDRKFERYVGALWLEENGRLSKHESQVNEAPGFDSRNGEAMGDIVHGFHPQLAYRPSFSFLRHDILGDGDHRLLRRTTSPSHQRIGVWRDVAI